MRNLLYIAFLLAVLTAYLATPAHAATYSTQMHEDGSYGSSPVIAGEYALIYWDSSNNQYIDIIHSKANATKDYEGIKASGMRVSVPIQATKALAKAAYDQPSAYYVDHGGVRDILAYQDAAYWWVAIVGGVTV